MSNDQCLRDVLNNKYVSLYLMRSNLGSKKFLMSRTTEFFYLDGFCDEVVLYLESEGRYNTIPGLKNLLFILQIQKMFHICLQTWITGIIMYSNSTLVRDWSKCS